MSTTVTGESIRAGRLHHHSRLRPEPVADGGLDRDPHLQGLGLVAFGQSVRLTKPQSCGVWLLLVGTQ